MLLAFFCGNGIPLAPSCDMQLVCRDKQCFLLKILLDALIHVETEPPLAVEEHVLCLHFEVGYIEASPGTVVVMRYGKIKVADREMFSVKNEAWHSEQDGVAGV